MNGTPWTCLSDTDNPEPEDCDAADHLMEILAATGVKYGEMDGESPMGFAHYLGLRITDEVWVCVVQRLSDTSEQDDVFIMTREVE